MVVPLSRRAAIPADNNVPAILATVCTLTAITIVVVLLRIYVRGFMLRNFGADDWVMCLVGAIAVAVLACWVEETKTGFGWHLVDIGPVEMERLGLFMFIHGLINMNAVSLVKVSVALNLRRFMTTKKQRFFLSGCVVFLLLFTLVCSFTIIFSCLPVAASWDAKLAATAKCYSIETFKDIAIFNSVINIATDLMFAILPIPIVLNLHTNLRTKITLALILSLGLFAGAAAIVKAVKQIQFFTLVDFSFEASYWVWHDIELNVGIVAASLPALRPLLAKFYDVTVKYTYGTGSRRGYENQYGQNGASKPYGTGSNNNYLRQKNEWDSKDPNIIGLKSFEERELFGRSADREGQQTYNAHVTSGSHSHKSKPMNYSRSVSIGKSGLTVSSSSMDRDKMAASNDYGSEETILGAIQPQPRTSDTPAHGPVSVLRGDSDDLPRHGQDRSGITKTTTVQISRI